MAFVTQSRAPIRVTFWAALTMAAIGAAPLIGPMLAERLDSAGPARPSGVTVTTVSEEKLAHVPGKTVTVQIVELAPGVVVPEHHHAGSVTVYVLSGTLRSGIAGQPVADYVAGESFFEAPGDIHLLAANPSPTQPVRFMAIHVADDGAQLTIYH
jgi:quercetin dioxygenase-like cupin family protein